MKKEISVIRVIAVCGNCGWTTTNYKNGQVLAAKHAKYYKHKVKCGLSVLCVYDGR